MVSFRKSGMSPIHKRSVMGEGEETMKRLFLSVMVTGLCIVLSATLVAAGTSPPAVGTVFPEIKFSVPGESDYRTYLGLSKGDHFFLQDIKTKVVLVEIVSMYCPHCQRHAPTVNELYGLIETNPALKGKIKLMGIAAGNSAYEKKVFRERYSISFPLFEDGDFELHDILGGVRTPYFIGVRIDNGVPRVFYSKLGGFDKADEFLKMIVEISGL
jgi:thiol-disulfide isomerase/thioredoxin